MKKVEMPQTLLNCVVFSIIFFEKPSLINSSAVDSKTISNLLSIATKLFDQHPSIISIKKKKFDSVLQYRI